ncbi:MAG: TIGR03943 family protein, partial [Planctomycetota bacterium]
GMVRAGSHAGGDGTMTSLARKEANRPHQKLEKILGVAVLAAWVLAFSGLLMSGNYRSYITPKLWPLLALGLVFLIVALIVRITAGRGHHDHGGRKALWVRTGILILPLLYLASVHGESLGAFAFNKRSVGFLPLPNQAGMEEAVEDGGEGLKARDLNELIWNYVRLSGRRVTTLGQVAKDASLPEGYFILFRFMINCCVADARPIALFVDLKGATDLEEDTWIKVTGVMETEKVSGRTALVIRTEEMERVDKPDDIYLYSF